MNDSAGGEKQAPGVKRYVGRDVVLDTKSNYVYLGLLKAVEDGFFVLEDADVHDCSQGRAGKDLYVLEAKRVGVVPNRTKVLVRESEVISVSALDEVSS